jgi:hypothetical protein
MNSVVTNFTMLILVSIAVNDNVTYVITDIKDNKFSTDFMFTTDTFSTDVSKFSLPLGYAKAKAVFRAADILCLVPL